MIKINLLPIRAARKREYIKQQVILGAVLLVGTGVGLYLWYNRVEHQIDTKKGQIQRAQQQIEQYKRAIGEVEKFKGLKATLQRKLATIAKLIKGKTGPVKVLDKLSVLIPKQVWLTKWDEKSGRLTLEGEALNNKFVAQFISALKESSGVGSAGSATEGLTTKEPGLKPRARFFSNVRLVDVEATADKSVNRNFVKFKLTMNVDYAI